MAVGTPTTAAANGNAPSVAVPAGVASGDIVVLAVGFDSSSASFVQANWPTGFTMVVDADGTGDGQSYGIAWKRLTAADTGSYTMANVGVGGDWAMAAIPLTGRHATNAPVVSANSIQNTLQVSPVTITTNGVTAVAGDDLLFVSLPDVRAAGVGNGHSAWAAGFTEIVDLEDPVGWSNVGVAKSENVSAGATGTKAVTFTLTSSTAGWGAWLLAVPAAAGGTTQVSASRRVNYAVQAQVAATRRVRYDVRAQVAATRRVAYSVLAAVVATRRITYSVQAQVASSRRVVYSVAGNVAAARRVVYGVNAQVSASRRVSYSVAAQVAGARRVAYVVSANVSASRRVAYAVNANVAAARRIVYVVQSANVTAPRHVVYTVGDAGALARTLSLLHIGG